MGNNEITEIILLEKGNPLHSRGWCPVHVNSVRRGAKPTVPPRASLPLFFPHLLFFPSGSAQIRACVENAWESQRQGIGGGNQTMQRYRKRADVNLVSNKSGDLHHCQTGGTAKMFKVKHYHGRRNATLCES